MDINYWKELKQYFDIEFMGVSLKDPIIFTVKLIVIYLFIRIITFCVKRFFKRAAARKGKVIIDDTNASFFSRIIVTVVYIIGISSVLALIPGMEKISSSIFASAGIIAMAIGLASQEALSNIVGGLFIIIAKPFQKGDFVEVEGGYIGTIEEITLRHTTIRSADGKLVIIPNSKINSSTIINSTIPDSRTCAFVEVGVSYETNLDHCIEIMRDEIEKHPSLIDTRTDEQRRNGVPKVIIRVIQLGDSAITLRAWAWAATNAEMFVMKCDLLKNIKERFDKEGIEIPYPYFNQIIRK